MTYTERHTVDITTDASGDGTGYTPVINGRISTIIYQKDGTAPYASGVDFAITLEATGQSLWAENNVNDSKTVAPRQKLFDEDGFGIAGQPDGGARVDYIPAAEDRVKIVVANGGNTKDGRFIVVVE